MGTESNYCASCGAKLKPGAKLCSACGAATGGQIPKNAPNAPTGPFPLHLIVRGRIQRLIQLFRSKGAVSPDTAMSVDELGLGPRFQMAMGRRLERLGIFVEINRKYYLSEERLKTIGDQMGTRRQW